MFLGFVLNEHAAFSEAAPAEGADLDLQRKVLMLARLCRALHEEVQWRWEAREEAQQSGGAVEPENDIVDALQRVYDAFCVTAISRMMQIAPLRPSLSALMMGLPAIPASALAVLKLLVTTGSRGAVVEKGREKSITAAADAHRNRGTRTEALMLLGQAVFSQDEVAGKDALMHLLKLCVSDDFELRSKVINLVVR